MRSIWTTPLEQLLKSVCCDAASGMQEQCHLQDLYVMAAEGKLTRYQLHRPQLSGPVTSSDLLGTPRQAAESPRYADSCMQGLLRK